MNSLYVTGVAIVLALAALALWRHMGSKRFPLYIFVIGDAIVWGVILCAVRFLASASHFQTVATVCGGYAVGMLAMYIAMHVYRS